MEIDLGPIEQFSRGSFQIVEILGKEYGVMRWHPGTVFVVRNICPHQLGPICAGRVGPKVTSRQVGIPTLDEAIPVLTCPWHKWEFILPTGVALRDRRYRIKSLPARLANGRVIVEVGRPGSEGLRE